MTRSRADWVATLRYGDRVVGERRIPEDGRLWVGDGGDLAIPGVPGRVALISDARLSAVPGLQTDGEIPALPAEDEVVTLTVAAHPAVTLAVTRERRQWHGFRRGLLRAPIMELAYGVGAAACVAALLAVAATTLDDSRLQDQHEDTREQDERSPIVLAMLETPKVAFVALPPPVVWDDDEDDGGGDDDDEIGGDEDSPEALPAAPPPEVLEQLEPDAEPPPSAAAIVREPDAPPRAVFGTLDAAEPDVAVAKILGAYSGDPDYSVLSVLSDDVDDQLTEGLEGSLLAILEDEAGVAGGVPGGLVGGRVVDFVDGGGGKVVDAVVGGVAGGVPGGVVDEGPGGIPSKVALGEPRTAIGGVGLRKIECEPVPAPKPQIDVVFVLDVSAGMIDALASISAQLSELDVEARKYDANPRYGLVAFVDGVKLVGGRDGFASAGALERAIDDLLSRAGTDRQLDGTQTNGERDDNGLDALHTAATQFAWRDAADTLRMVVYASSAAAADEGAVLSGGTVAHGYAGVQAALTARSIRVASFTDAAGAAGFSASRGGRASLPERTRGEAFDLDRLASGRLGLRSALEGLLSNPECTDGPAVP